MIPGLMESHPVKSLKLRSKLLKLIMTPGLMESHPVKLGFHRAINLLNSIRPQSRWGSPYSQVVIIKPLKLVKFDTTPGLMESRPSVIFIKAISLPKFDNDPRAGRNLARQGCFHKDLKSLNSIMNSGSMGSRLSNS